MLAATSPDSLVTTEGFAIVEGVLSTTDVHVLIAALERVANSGFLSRGGKIYAIRNLLDVSPEICALAHTPEIRALIESVLGPRCFPVRGILFDKVPGANWKVPWHQDVTIAVQARVDVEGWGPWSTKVDVLHVQPPAAILEQMLSIRLHLDPCGEDNGALRVLPGSHLHGRLPESQIQAIRQRTPERVCAVGIGGALLMRPLLLHASSPSSTPDHRRVVHLDFASVDLPTGMRWFSESQSA